MYKSPYFNSRFLNAYYLNGGLPYSSEVDYFNGNYFGADYFKDQFFGHLEGNQLTPVYVTSIAIQVSPSTVTRNSAVTITAFVYDQFNKPMQDIRVDFQSSNAAVLTSPSYRFTDTLGKAVQTAVVGSAGTANITAIVEGLSAFTAVTVTSVVGGTTYTLTHGATIQQGSAGGGSPGPIGIKFSRRRRWPTR